MFFEEETSDLETKKGNILLFKLCIHFRVKSNRQEVEK